MLALEVDIRSKVTQLNPDYLPLTGEPGAGLSQFITAIVNLAVVLSGIAMFIFFVWGGYTWLMAGEDKTKVEAARSRMTNAFIGVAIVVAAYSIFKIIDQFFALGLTK